jgi:tetratricopeptide (TPR) repeat protein
VSPGILDGLPVLAKLVRLFLLRKDPLVQSYTRRQLKQDRFVEATNEAVHWTAEHRNTLIVIAAIAAIAIAAFAGWTFYVSKQEEQASIALGNAVRTANAPIREGEPEPDATNRSFSNYKDRAAAAFNEYQQIADKYPHAQSGHYAGYLAGVAALQKDDTAAAEAAFKKAADTDKHTAVLAKFALANLYSAQGKTDEAAKNYREVIEADRVAVPKSQAELALAEMYEAKKNPSEAVKVYDQIIKDEQAKVKELEKAEGKSDKGDKAAAEPIKTPLQQQAEAKVAQLKAAAGEKK